MIRTPHRPARYFIGVLTAAALCLAASVAMAQTEGVADDAPRLGEIIIEGNTRTNETLIRREMGLELGQVFEYDDMDAVWDHLEDLGYFAFVDMEYDDMDPSHVVLRVMVEEDETLSFGPLLRYSRRHKYFLGAQAKERNLRGAGETFEAALSVLYIQWAEMAWTRPWLAGVKGLQLRVDARAERADFVFRATRYRKWDTGAELRWAFAGPFYGLGSATYGSFDQLDDFSYPAPDRGEGSGGSIYHPARVMNHWVFQGGLGLDTRDSPYYPLKGLYAEGRVARWTSDDFPDYTEGIGDVRAFIPVPIRKHLLALRAWGRQVDGPSQLDNHLWFGGPETVRGQTYASREGDEGYLLTAEYRAPLFIMPISPNGEMIGVGLHAFYDVGDTWFYGADAGRSMQGWGGGMHLILDTWQLRFEAANTEENGWMFEFMDRFNF